MGLWGWGPKIFEIKNFELIDSLKNYNINEIGLGFKHIITSTDNGSIFSWGTSFSGESGIPNYSINYFPKEVLNLKKKKINIGKIIKIECSYNFSTFLDENGWIFYFGNLLNKIKSTNFNSYKFIKNTNRNLEINFIKNENIIDFSILLNEGIVALTSDNIIEIYLNENINFKLLSVNKISKLIVNQNTIIGISEDFKIISKWKINKNFFLTFDIKDIEYIYYSLDFNIINKYNFFNIENDIFIISTDSYDKNRIKFKDIIKMNNKDLKNFIEFLKYKSLRQIINIDDISKKSEKLITISTNNLFKDYNTSNKKFKSDIFKTQTKFKSKFKKKKYKTNNIKHFNLILVSKFINKIMISALKSIKKFSIQRANKINKLLKLEKYFKNYNIRYVNYFYKLIKKNNNKLKIKQNLMKNFTVILEFYINKIKRNYNQSFLNSLKNIAFYHLNRSYCKSLLNKVFRKSNKKLQVRWFMYLIKLLVMFKPKLFEIIYKNIVINNNYEKNNFYKFKILKKIYSNINNKDHFSLNEENIYSEFENYISINNTNNNYNGSYIIFYPNSRTKIDIDKLSNSKNDELNINQFIPNIKISKNSISISNALKKSQTPVNQSSNKKHQRRISDNSYQNKNPIKNRFDLLESKTIEFNDNLSKKPLNISKNEIINYNNYYIKNKFDYSNKKESDNKDRKYNSNTFSGVKGNKKVKFNIKISKKNEKNKIKLKLKNIKKI